MKIRKETIFKIIKEEIERELSKEEKHKIVSFDFDDTLTFAPFDPEEEDFVYKGPHEEMMKKIRGYIEDPEVTVYIVTSRMETANAEVEDFVTKQGLKVDGIYYTNANWKAPTLKELGVTLHHDDDSEENKRAGAAGIQTVPSNPYGDYGTF